MTVNEIMSSIRKAWLDVEEELLEYLRMKEIPPIKIDFCVENNAAWNMKSNPEPPYRIVCFHGIYYAISDALDEFNIEDNKKEEYAFTLLKMILWHEIFHILLGHKITKEDKERIKRDNDEIVLRQLEYIADGMAIRTYMPFIITKKEGLQYEKEMSQFLTLLYAYYLKMDNQEKVIGVPTDHPQSNVRLELLLMCASGFITEWNSIVPEKTIDFGLLCDLCSINLERANIEKCISEIDLADEVQKIVDINYEHWIWKKCINPTDNEFCFK